ncbi:hypothetical protein [Dethiothermospora halolimnae]|uniref:hypothetical protein n=1 Tax=Dethiothermospora halolimnae TaxID=3114390 RepID=UPI003CCC0741
MELFLEIIISSFITVLSVIKNPIYWVMVIIVGFQYKRIGDLEKKILSVNKKSVIERTLKSMVMGLVGGLLGSFIILLLGININLEDFKYIFIMAILLMLIHPRFLCFSYGGGVLSLLSLTLGFPKINVSSIMAIVAILHLIESFLILIDGENSKIPIFVEYKNRIVGGFNIIRFWPVPFIVLIIGEGITEGGMSPTELWPIFRLGDLGMPSENIFLMMAGVIAVLGYSDISITDYPRRKLKKSSIYLMIFSIILLLLSIISSHIYLFKYIAALFSPIVHEAIIQHGKRKKGRAVYAPSKIGVKVLDTIPNKWGHTLGIRSGDIILAINGTRINTKDEINQVLSYNFKHLRIDYYDINNNLISKDIRSKDYIKSLGLLVVPRHSSYALIVSEKESPIINIIKWLKNRLNK